MAIKGKYAELKTAESFHLAQASGVLPQGHGILQQGGPLAPSHAGRCKENLKLQLYLNYLT